MESDLIDVLTASAERFGKKANDSREEMLAAARLRQEAILGLKAEGLSVREIGSRLGLSHTVVQQAVTTARKLRPAKSRREERFPYELHVMLMPRVVEDPEAVRTVGRRNLEAMKDRPMAPVARKWVDRWAEILELPPADLAKHMLEDSEEGRDLRQVSPFAGVLDQRDRLVAMKKARFLETA